MGAALMLNVSKNTIAFILQWKSHIVRGNTENDIPKGAVNNKLRLAFHTKVFS